MRSISAWGQRICLCVWNIVCLCACARFVRLAVNATHNPRKMAYLLIIINKLLQKALIIYTIYIPQLYVCIHKATVHVRSVRVCAAQARASSEVGSHEPPGQNQIWRCSSRAMLCIIVEKMCARYLRRFFDPNRRPQAHNRAKSRTHKHINKIPPNCMVCFISVGRYGFDAKMN